ncbi:hypothetical protein D3C76_1609450 [compost metagenome]
MNGRLQALLGLVPEHPEGAGLVGFFQPAHGILASIVVMAQQEHRQRITLDLLVHRVQDRFVTAGTNRRAVVAAVAAQATVVEGVTWHW